MAVVVPLIQPFGGWCVAVALREPPIIRRVIASNSLTFSPPRGRLPVEAAELSALAGHVRAGRCSLFVGAGLSAPAGLPTWGALMQQLVEQATPWAVDPALFAAGIDLDDGTHDLLAQSTVKPVRTAVGRARFDALCRRVQHLRGGRLGLRALHDALDIVHHDSVDRAELARLAAARRYTEMAEHCRTRLGPARFHALIARALHARQLPPTHRDIVRTPFACVVTTNFDTLIEDAYSRYAGFVPRAPTGAELGQQGTLLLDRAFFVLKAHGDAARPETMVFTADDYRRIIHETPAFQAVMGGILLTNAVLFVGYSLNDPNFRLLLDNQLSVFNGFVPPRYAILEGVGDAEADIMWRTSKLQVLSYPPGQHQEVGRFLLALADDAGGPVPAASRETARRPPRGGAAHATLHVRSDGRHVNFELERPVRGVTSSLVSAAEHPGTPAWGRLFREADRQAARGRSPLRAVREVGRKLAQTLPPTLTRALRALPPLQPLEIACSPAATAVPWEWLDPGNGSLCLRRPVVRRPVGISHQARGRQAAATPLRVLLIGDAGDAYGGQLHQPLYYAELEVQALERLLLAAVPDAVVTRVSREAATHARVMHELERGRHDVVHFSGHAWFDDREAYFYLWDRLVLGSELAPLLTRWPPALMVLNTHYTAFVMSEVDARPRELVERSSAHAEPGATPTPRGFAEAALRCGVTAFVGPFGSVADLPAAEVAMAFYAALLRGAALGEALLAARRSSVRDAADSGCFYTAFGYLDFHLVSPTHPRRRPSVGRAKKAVGWPVA